jgi:hypothetical protein
MTASASTSAAAGANPASSSTEKLASPLDSPRTLREALPIFLGHASPRILVAALATALVARIAVGGWSWRDLVVVAVVALYWPIQEWLIHVFILHAKPVRILGRTFDPALPRKHRLHHRDPWNYHILFIPLHTYVYTLPLLVFLCFTLTPTAALALTALVAHLSGTLHYEAVHFGVHTRVTPKGRFYQRLWQNHRLHHFKNEKFWYGVTRLEGDRLLGTGPDPASVALSPTARTLVG